MIRAADTIKYLNVGIATLQKPLKVKDNPIYIQVEPTNNCNMRCKMCNRVDLVKNPKNMSLKNFKKIVNVIQPKKIALSGFGEPFMNPHLLEMVSYAKRKGISVLTTSNFTLTHKMSAKIVKSGLDLIKISIDAATKETYEKIRGQYKFGVIIDNIRELLDAKRELSSETPFIRFNCVLQKDNFHEIGDIIKLGKDLDIDATYFQMLELVGIEEKRDFLIGDLTYSKMKKELVEAKKLSEQLKINTNISSIVKNFSTYWAKYQNKQLIANNKRKCLVPWFLIYITVDGSVRPCCSFSFTKADMGNIFEQNFEEIWNGHKYQQLRKVFKKGIRPYRICKNCIPQTHLDLIKLQTGRLLPGFLSDYP